MFLEHLRNEMFKDRELKFARRALQEFIDYSKTGLTIPKNCDPWEWYNSEVSSEVTYTSSAVQFDVKGHIKNMAKTAAWREFKPRLEKAGTSHVAMFLLWGNQIVVMHTLWSTVFVSQDSFRILKSGGKLGKGIVVESVRSFAESTA